MAKIIIEDKNFEKPITYFMNDRIKKNLDEIVIPALKKKDKDYVLSIDGMEGSGKSTLAFQVGKYVDRTLNLDRVVFNAEDFRQAIFKAKKGQCIVYDEAFTGFSSRASLSAINRVLVSLMMQMRQKNLFVIIVLPTFFLLDKYVALYRARALIHVYENKGIRGYFRLYSRKIKRLLYMTGQKTYSYKIRTPFKGRFYGVFALGDENYEKKYRKKKIKALEDTEKNPMTAGQVKYREQRNLLMYLLRKNTHWTYKQIEEYLADYNLSITYQQIAKICASFGDIDEEPKNLSENKDKNEDNKDQTTE